MGQKVFSNERVTVLAGLASGISDWNHPILSELAALKNVSGAVNWNSFDLNLKASDQKDDRTLTDGAGAQSRGFTNFGGNLQFVNPTVDDLSSIYRDAYNIFSTPRVELVVAVRYGPKKNSQAPAAADRWTLYHVIVDAPFFGQNDVSKYYQVTLVARDDILIQYIIPAATPTAVALTGLDVSVTVGDLVFISAAYQGWDITKEAAYVVSDQTKLEEVHPGIFRAKATGSPTVKGQYPGGTDSPTLAITIA